MALMVHHESFNDFCFLNSNAEFCSAERHGLLLDSESNSGSGLWHPNSRLWFAPALHAQVLSDLMSFLSYTFFEIELNRICKLTGRNRLGVGT